jgi:DNA-binding CsgD family transcriptional regulator/PAS domain-containing protein
VADGLSELLDGAGAVLSARRPKETRMRLLFAAGIDADTGAGQADAFLDQVYATPATRQPFVRGFAFGPSELGFPSLGHFMGSENGQPIASALVLRAPGGPDFTLEQQGLAERLVPHLDRAVTLSRTLFRAAQQRRALSEVVGRLAGGVFLLSEEGKVVFSNRSGMRILERRDALSIADGALHAEDHRINRSLQKLIAAAVTPKRAAAGSGAGSLAIPRKSGAAYPVSVSRLLPGRSLRDSVAGVMVIDPGAGTEPAVELLRNLHDLTAAEADLVSHLVRGHSLEETARARGVTINTVRSQIKQVFHKTGTSRQGELVQLVLGCFLPMVDE